ncbi:MAG: tetratricopeptide repeat protein [Ramlibacter sp.]|nr:tetratricopeptide repeat protein [Ramlibacter sp.]
MLRFTPLALALILAGGAQCAAAQTPEDGKSPSDPPVSSALDGELFYQLLLGEINAQGNEPGTAYALILDAARKTNDAKLYQRAVDIAFQARSGDSALQAAQAWKQAQPESREANRYVLQILIALNRLQDTLQPLRDDLALVPAANRNAAVNFLPRFFARAADKKQAASVVEQALGDYLMQASTGAAAWTTVGRMRLAAGDSEGALDAVRRAQKVDAAADGPALLALELMAASMPQAEPLLTQYLDGRAAPEIRMGYARVLLDAQRYAEAAKQLEAVTAQRPEFAEAWLIQGTLQVQDNQQAAAEASLKRYVDLVSAQPASAERSRGLAQAYLSLAQIAEKRKDYPGAEAWLNRIENAQDMISAQNRRASILARQGKLDEARKLLRGLPERNPGDARMKLMAEVQLLRDNQQFQPAYDLLASAVAKEPRDTDLLYDQAILAEKLGKPDDMERLLRQVIAIKPDAQHAYNALGYSLADRNVRLTEARSLIRQALKLAPGDPFITDSLGWVEFRMGHWSDALRILEGAYKSRPDPEIAAHLGEVLWTLGLQDRAVAVLKEGLLLNADHPALLATVKRLGIKL